MSRLAGRRVKVRRVHSLAGSQDRALGLPSGWGDSEVHCAQATEGRFDEQPGETSAVVNQSLINGGPNSVEVQWNSGNGLWASKSARGGSCARLPIQPKTEQPHRFGFGHYESAKALLVDVIEIMRFPGDGRPGVEEVVAQAPGPAARPASPEQRGPT